MGVIDLAVAAPHATAYDEDFPTRSTENYAHTVHNILQDMEDATGEWWLSDQNPTGAEQAEILTRATLIISKVFDYAEDAIQNYRDHGTPDLDKPVYADLPLPKLPKYNNQWLQIIPLWTDCMKKMFLIYYLWETEEDPLLIQEKIRELLVAWPLTDTEIVLNEEGGQTMRITPAWKNVDI